MLLKFNETLKFGFKSYNTMKLKAIKYITKKTMLNHELFHFTLYKTKQIRLMLGSNCSVYDKKIQVH